jgi:hypothetical protein
MATMYAWREVLEGWIDRRNGFAAQRLISGATRRDRTGDLLITNQPLYQLS